MAMRSKKLGVRAVISRASISQNRDFNFFTSWKPVFKQNLERKLEQIKKQAKGCDLE